MPVSVGVRIGQSPAQNTQSGKNSNNSHGENLPQTGEEQYAVSFIIGIVMLTSVAGVMIFSKKK